MSAPTRNSHVIKKVCLGSEEERRISWCRSLVDRGPKELAGRFSAEGPRNEKRTEWKNLQAVHSACDF
jgi:hypothetical protein